MLRRTAGERAGGGPAARRRAGSRGGGRPAAQRAGRRSAPAAGARACRGHDGPALPQPHYLGVHAFLECLASQQGMASGRQQGVTLHCSAWHAIAVWLLGCTAPTAVRACLVQQCATCASKGGEPRPAAQARAKKPHVMRCACTMRDLAHLQNRALPSAQEQDGIVAELTAAVQRLQARLAAAARDAAAAAAAAMEPSERRRLGAELAELHGRLGAASVSPFEDTQDWGLQGWAGGAARPPERRLREPLLARRVGACTGRQATHRG